MLLYVWPVRQKITFVGTWSSEKTSGHIFWRFSGVAGNLEQWDDMENTQYGPMTCLSCTFVLDSIKGATQNREDKTHLGPMIQLVSLSLQKEVCRLFWRVLQAIAASSVKALKLLKWCLFMLKYLVDLLA